MIEIEEDFFAERGPEMTRMSLRAQKLERRGHIRNTLLLVGGILLMGCLAAGVVLILTLNSGGLKVPKIIGMKYADAKKKVESVGLFIEIDSMQDSSGDCSKLAVTEQDPKPGAGVDVNEIVVVRLKGLHESPEFVNGDDSPGVTDAQTAPASSPAAAPAEGQPQSSTGGKVVCIDPGHSPSSGNEIDAATGLNVGDNEGCSGEIQDMWDLAQKVKAKLEQAGYTVRLTKDGPDSYASLRSRADTGNTCSVIVRLHYDDSGFTGVLRPPANGARCPTSDPSRITVVDPNVAALSDALAQSVAGTLGLSVKNDTGGTSRGNGTPPGHPTALIGSVLSRVPVICIENEVGRVRDNPAGQDQVAAQTVEGIKVYFQSH